MHFNVSIAVNLFVLISSDMQAGNVLGNECWTAVLQTDISIVAIHCDKRLSSWMQSPRKHIYFALFNFS